jgi:hypothetical protein
LDPVASSFADLLVSVLLRVVLPLRYLRLACLLTDILLVLQVPGRCLEAPQDTLYFANRPEEADH